MLKSFLWIALLGLVAFAARCHNWRETFIEGHIYYVDGDCYARMTRARIIDQHPGTIIHHHAFENYPQGVRSHTTAPMDYAIVVLKRVLSFFSAQSLDLAGALISPLLGALTCMYLAWWCRWGLAFSEGAHWPHLVSATPLFFAFSPVLVHSGLLGRPDHQAPMILFVAVALTAEFTLWQGPVTRAWSVTAGLMWGMALWISLYEPLILLLLMLAVLVIFARPSLRQRERWWELGTLLGIVVLMLAIEGSPIPQLDPQVKEYFPRWRGTVSELNPLDLRSGLIFRWLGMGCLVAPVLLIIAARRGNRRAWGALILLLATFTATCMHLRWGYFVGLAFALALPWVLFWPRRRWLAWVCFFVSLSPLAAEWEGLLYPDPEWLAERQRERKLLREVAAHLTADPHPGGPLPFLAPWWLSPALAYWSGEPGVSGSSHEGLPGIVDSARFYLAQKAETAAEVIERRQLAFVVVDDPQRLLETSAPLLNVPVPKRSLADTLYHAPHSGPAFLVLTFQNQYYKLFAIDAVQLRP